MKAFFARLLKPYSLNEDIARKEYLLNILLFGFSLLSAVAFSTNLRHFIILRNYSHGTPQLTGLVFLFSLLLFFFSKRGKSHVVSRVFLVFLLLIVFYLAFTWGPLLPGLFFLSALVVTIAGITISTRCSVICTFLILTLLGTVTYLNSRGYIVFNDTWKYDTSPNLGNVITLSLGLGMLVVISWLYNNELEKSLRRAHASESALRKERDLLEERVEGRTRELRETQKIQIEQMHHFAAFGRLASGFVHDIANPLTALTLGLEELDVMANNTRRGMIEEIQIGVRKANQNIARMSEFVTLVRKQLQKGDSETLFSLQEEIFGVISMLEYKTRKNNVRVLVDNSEESIMIYGNQIKFFQMLSNLISNAIDSYITASNSFKKVVYVGVKQHDGVVMLSVLDRGMGISDDHIDHIFEPFFTTKDLDSGTGLGLALVKDIVEHDFNGTITVESYVGKGSLFTIRIPLWSQVSCVLKR